MKNILKNKAVQIIVLLITSLTIAFMLGEGIIYLLYKNKIAIFPRYVTNVQYNDFQIRRNVPNAHYYHRSPDGKWKFKINSSGFRDFREFDYQKPENTHRILVLGDSFTIGYEVRQDQTFSSIMERYLQKNGMNVEVINAGMSGNSTAEELVFFKEEGLKYKPDVVVLGFFHNDVTDNVRTNMFLLNKDTLILQNKKYLPAIKTRNFLNSFWFYRWMSQHSYLHNYLNAALTVFLKKRMTMDNLASLKEKSVQETGESRYGKRYEVLLTIALVKQMYAIARDNHVLFVLLDIPYHNLSPSFPWTKDPDVGQFADIYFDSGAFLKEYEKLIDIFRPNGHHHWTEFAHLITGIELAKLLAEKFARD